DSHARIASTSQPAKSPCPDLNTTLPKSGSSSFPLSTTRPNQKLPMTKLVNQLLEQSLKNTVGWQRAQEAVNNPENQTTVAPLVPANSGLINYYKKSPVFPKKYVAWRLLR